MAKTKAVMESGTPPIIEVCDLSISYHTPSASTRALRGASIEIHGKETVALVGETGSGKSTLALAILGLLENQSQSGDILYKGRSMRSLTRRDWNNIRGPEIGMVFQDSRSALNPVLTILDHLVETIRAHQKISAKEARARGGELLREVGIPESEEKLYPFELSGGTCQRAGIALGICNAPGLLIADEPTSAIDTALQAQILELLQEMKGRHGLSLLLISHDLPLVSQVADRICVMYHGRVVESGLKREILESPAHPYTRDLIRCQPSFLHHHETNRVPAIPGIPPRAGQEFRGCAFAPRCALSEPRCVESLPAALRTSKTRSAECIKADIGYKIQDPGSGMQDRE